MICIKEILLSSLDKNTYTEKAKLIESSRNVTVILEGKELYIKKYTFNKIVNIDKAIMNEISKQFHVDDCLFHYEVERKLIKNNVILYSINNDVFLRNFQHRWGKVRILPIQMGIFKKFIKKYKEREFTLFFRNGSIIYKMIGENGKLIFSENIDFFNFQEEVIEAFYKEGFKSSLYIDKKIIIDSKSIMEKKWDDIKFIQEDWYSVS